MKALFTGLGSIGQRHLMNFKELFREVQEEDSEILAYRSIKHNKVIKNCAVIPCVSLADYYGIKEYYNLDEALNQRPEVVFITNPSSKHMEVALKAAEAGSNIFIEKPLSHNMDGVNSLQREVEKKSLIVMVGYQMRFHPCYKYVKNILSEKKYGSVISANFEWGTYLPLHHPYEDYRQGYAAKKNLGGGVVLGLIHEIDMIYQLWGHPEKLWAVGGKLSSLEMDAEDTVSVLMKMRQDGYVFPVNLFLSYAQTKEMRNVKIQFERAVLFCDFLSSEVNVYDRKGELTDKSAFPRLKKDELFKNEIKEFIMALKENRQPSVSLKDGVESLLLALRIKEEINE